MKEIWSELIYVGSYENEAGKTMLVYAGIAAWHDEETTHTLRIDIDYRERVDGTMVNIPYMETVQHFTVIEPGTNATRYIISTVDAHVAEVRTDLTKRCS